MKIFAGLSVLYLGVALVVAYVARDHELRVFVMIAAGGVEFLVSIWRWIVGFSAAVVLMFAVVRNSILSQRTVAMMYALVGALVFQGAFIVFKTTLPFIVPFFADGFLAGLDRTIHAGVDPFVFTHRLAQPWMGDALTVIYIWVWLVPALFFPVLLAATDTDHARVRRFMILFGVAWVLLGNVLALGGMSVGPVFYDRLLGGVRFADLTEALAISGVAGGRIGTVQDFLWWAYSEHGQTTGSGIAAFPSVHVGMATVLALYLCERSRLLVPIGVLFLAAIQFTSVYTGYHYGVDGYVAFFVVFAAWLVLRRKFQPQRTGDAT